MRSQVTTLGTKIREARKAAGMNADRLAASLGVTVRTVQRWESGDTEPTFSRLSKIAAVTEHDLAFFLTEVAAA